MGYKVVLTDHVFPEATLVEEVRSQLGVDLEVHECLDEAELCRITRDADAVIVERAQITPRVIAAMERCRIIVRHGVGFDTLNVDAATEAGICVCNVTDYCTQEVSDHAMALLLALSRSLFPLDASVRRGEWNVFGPAGKNRRIEGQILGLVGFGKIGQAVARRAQGFGMQVIAYDPFIGADVMDPLGVRKLELDDLLKESDLVSLHLPLSEKTRHLINGDRIRMMKPTAFLVNTARGGLVDQQALVAAMSEGHLAGAGLDTFEGEPPAADDPVRKLPNVIMTPHAAFYSTGSLRQLHWRVSRQVTQLLVGSQRPDNLVNPAVMERLRKPLA